MCFHAPAPALFTKTSTGGSIFTTSLTPSADVTSQGATTASKAACVESPLHSSAAVSNALRVRLQRITFAAPRFAASRAIASPSPELAPVTSTVRSRSRVALVCSASSAYSTPGRTTQQRKVVHSQTRIW